jgi:hypothetical protein
MSNNVNSQFQTITHALEHGNLLAYNQKKGEFEEVGWLGRMVRNLGKLLGKKEAFNDCYAPVVGNKIVEFVKENAKDLTPIDKDRIVNDLQFLQNRLKKNYINIEMNRTKINDNFATWQKESSPPPDIR